jgi:uncharacterized protein (TIGR02246 family)
MERPMNRRNLLTLLGLGAAAMTLPYSASAHTIDGDDTQAIRDLVTAYETAWNTSDLDALGALYTDDIHWVNVKGMHWQGFGAVDKAHRVYFDIMFRGTRQDLEEIESVMPVAPGVVIAVVRWLHGPFSAPSGDKVPAMNTRMTLVLTKASGAWKIAHGANIEVDAGAARFDPVNGAAIKG